MGLHLLEAMSARRVPYLVSASTVMAHYGGEEYRPLNLYAATKQAFSDLLAYYVDTGLLRAVTLVLSDTYGPGDHRPKVLNLIRDAAQKGAPMALSRGDQDYDVVHIDDVTAAFQTAGLQLLEGLLRGGTFQVVPEAPLTLRATVGKLLHLHNSSWQGGWGQRPKADREILRAIRVYPSLPGWRPIVSLEKGLSRLEWED